METGLGLLSQVFVWLESNPLTALGGGAVLLGLLFIFGRRSAYPKVKPRAVPERVQRELDFIARKKELLSANPKGAQQRGITLADMAAFRPQRETPEVAASGEEAKTATPESSPKGAPRRRSLFASLTQYTLKVPAPDDLDTFAAPAGRQPKEPHPQEEAAPASIRCAHCGREIEAQARFCGFCGKKPQEIQE